MSAASAHLASAARAVHRSRAAAERGHLDERDAYARLAAAHLHAMLAGDTAETAALAASVEIARTQGGPALLRLVRGAKP